MHRPALAGESDEAALSPAPLVQPALRRWLALLAILVVVAAAFVALFPAESVQAFTVWNESTAYNHCYLIVPISLFLIWERRRALLASMPAPTPWPLLTLPPVGLVWLFADQAGIMEGRQLAAMTLFQLLIFAVLGFRAWRIIGFALLYLFFLVPFGAFVTPVLQDFAARFAIRWLDILGIPVFSDGYEIDVPGARFVVAEACAGLRFLIASIALGALYGYMMYRSVARRIAFLSVSIVVPVIANGFRVLGIVMLGYWLGNAQAAAADHLIYGWVFFSAVSLLLILMGLPFREPATEFPLAAAGRPVQAPGPRLPVGALLVGAAGLAIVALLVNPIVAEGAPARAMAAGIAALRHALGR